MVSMITCPQCQTSNRIGAKFCARCGYRFVAPSGPMPPASYTPVSSPSHPLTGMLPANSLVADRYLISRKVGQGGMAAVYDAIDTRTQRRVALKEMSDSMIASPVERTQALAQFRQEAQMLANLDHPNLPKVTDVFDFDGKQYLAMDFVDGLTLEAMLQQKRRPLPEADVKRWAAQLCDVLNYLHTCQIIFRDLKPGNIMIDRAGNVKLIDFGIARLFKPGKSRDTVSLGTVGYAAPEQLGAAQSDARTDIYALGVTLYELLTGYDPTSTPMNLPPLRQLNAYVSPVMEQVITRALEPDRNRRWQSVAEIKFTLTGSLPASSAQPRLPTVPMRSNRPTTRLLMSVAQLTNRQIAIAGTAVLIVLVIGLWFGTPILAQYPVIWNNIPSFAIVAPLVYAAVRRPWFAPTAHVVVTLVGALITGARTFGNDPAMWRLEPTLFAAIVTGAIVEGATRLLPKIRGKNRDEAWQRELAWLDAMAFVVSILMVWLVWGSGWGLNPIMWFAAIVMGTLGWFIGDSIQQAIYLQQTGIKRGRGG